MATLAGEPVTLGTSALFTNLDEKQENALREVFG